MANSKIVQTLKSGLHEESIHNTGIYYVYDNYITGANIASDQWRLIDWRDKNYNRISYIGTTVKTNGEHAALWLINNKINNVDTYNYLRLGVKADGTMYVEIPANDSLKASWRNAIGAASSDHNHNTIYYTKTETDTKLNEKLNISNSLTKLVTYVTDGKTDLDTAITGTMLVSDNSNYNSHLYNALNNISGFAYVSQIFYGSLSAGSPHVQIAFPYDRNTPKFAWRVYGLNAGFGSWNVVDSTDSGWLTAASSTGYTGSIFYRKIGKMVTVTAYDIKSTSDISASSGKGLGSIIPIGYRPAKPVTFVIRVHNSLHTASSFITSDGNLYLYSPDTFAISTNDTLCFTTTYFLE